MVKKLYEAMFLVGSADAAADWDGVNTTIRNVLGRAEAEIVSIDKWDERKLAYEINGHNRGTYILCYFRVEGGRIRDIERDVQLSERIMRVLILCAEGREKDDVEEDAPVVPAEKYEKETAHPVRNSIGDKNMVQKAQISNGAQQSAQKAEAEQVEPQAQ